MNPRLFIYLFQIFLLKIRLSERNNSFLNQKILILKLYNQSSNTVESSNYIVGIDTILIQDTYIFSNELE